MESVVGFLYGGGAGGVEGEEGGGGLLYDDTTVERWLGTVKCARGGGSDRPLDDFVPHSFETFLDFRDINVFTPGLFAFAGGLIVLLRRFLGLSRGHYDELLRGKCSTRAERRVQIFSLRLLFGFS